MKYLLFISVALFCITLVTAHGTAEEHALEEEEQMEIDFGPLGGGPNDLAKVLPWKYFLAGKWVEGIVVTALWIVTIGGIGKLLFILLAKQLK